MEFSVPFAYRTRRQAPISGKITEIIKVERIDREIKQIGLCDTELVARWMHIPYARREYQTFECRRFDGDFYYIIGEMSRPRTTEQVASDLSRKYRRSDSWYTVSRHAWHYDGGLQSACRSNLAGEPPSARSTLGKEIETDCEAARAWALRGLDDLLIIDGVFWCRAAAPRISLVVPSSENFETGRLSVSAQPMLGSPEGLNHPSERPVRSSRYYEFPFDDMAEAFRFGEAKGLRLSGDVSSLEVIYDFDQGPTADNWLTGKRATEIVYELANRIGGAPDIVINRWLDLRAIVEVPTPPDASYLHSCIVGLDEAMRAHGTRNSTVATYLDDYRLLDPIPSNNATAGTTVRFK